MTQANNFYRMKIITKLKLQLKFSIKLYLINLHASLFKTNEKQIIIIIKKRREKNVGRNKIEFFCLSNYNNSIKITLIQTKET